MGFFQRRPPEPVVVEKTKAFRIELGWRGLLGLMVICFFLLLWMFLLGIWAGQTILLPPKDNRQVGREAVKAPPAVRTEPEAKSPSGSGPGME